MTLHAKTPNQALERTATRPGSTFFIIKAFSLRATVAPGAVAQLALVRWHRSGGNDGLSRDSCAAGPTPDLHPGPPGGGTTDHADARVPG
jgi:hypothetical protein